jgi:16S rRNA (guanine527-N7)-methyltransferase
MKPPFNPAPETNPGPDFIRGCGAIGVSLHRGQMHRLCAFVHGLVEANQTVNLVRFGNLNELWIRHVLDSLTLAPHVDEQSAILDVGSGGGFPGIVLALAMEQFGRVALVESTGKKCRFLQQACDALGLETIEVLHDRAENLAHQDAFRAQFDVVTARALAPLPTLLELSAPFARVGGRILAMKGARAEQEVSDASRACDLLSITLNRRIHPTDLSNSSPCILEFVKNAATALDYPRRTGMAAKRPL